ncbi:helix-turn-helix transcriptional regulator [Microbacterium foliorum]|uniref:helix-turn-helix transcriptional regulator n=1 Tax=Microbacterium foliorum TaxID=104336 RepID=UPI001E4761FA|nr:helix-turn-helix domain-containing protein [Microbacterium foliorum]
MKFRAVGREALLGLRPLESYMASVNIQFAEVREENTPLRANLVRLGRFLFAHVQLPASTVVWPRDEASQKRVVMIAAEGTGLEVHSDSPVIARRSSWFVVPPGTDPVTFHATTTTELVFVSLDDTELVGDRRVGFEHVSDEDPAESVLRPLINFVKSLCAIEPKSAETAPTPLGDAACEVGRALVAAVVGEPAQRADVFDEVMRILLQDYSSPHLSLPAIAHALGISVRSVQSALSAHGTTFSDELRTVRVTAATELVSQHPDLLLGEVAKLVGFGTRQSLYRAMRKTPNN